MSDATTSTSARDAGLLLIRVVFGGLMAWQHGWGKMKRLFSDDPSFADPLGLGEIPSLALAAGAELVCATLIVVGLATRAAAIPLVITMGVAAFVQHGDDIFGDGEMALLYGAAFGALIALGPGGWAASAAYAKPGDRGFVRWILT